MSDLFRKGKSNFATTLVTGIGTGTGDTITLNSATGLPTDTEIVLTFNRVTSGGVVNSTSVMERIKGTISGATLTAYSRGVDGTTEQSHAGGTVVEYIPNAADMNDQVDGILVGHNQDGTHKKEAINFNAPEGFLINGKIVPSVASNDLTVALKGLDGNDPSATNPVYVRIGDTVHAITAALSVTKADGTNWFNAGSTELATQEIDYFVYLGYNATDGVVIGFARIPYATAYSQFSATTTNEKYCAISTISNAAAGDDYTVVGRFAATLSAGAGYTWSVPTFTSINLIQRPIFESRLLYWLPTYAGSGSLTYGTVNSYMGTRSGYKVLGSNVWICLLASGTTGGTTNTAITASLPFNTYLTYGTIASWTADGAAYSGGNATLDNTKIVSIKKYDSSNWGLGTGRQISINGNISLTS